MAQVCGVVRNGKKRREGRDIGVGGTRTGGVAYTRESDVVGLPKHGDVGRAWNYSTYT
jgi:hypothetical protein